ncbi:MAG: N-acetylmannosamine-6-phosphate 2-epimerase [Cyanobacteria bacterium SIG31]|nr:N-acetylmannosamine-6-phosphate 2-epimerase [Cyanobacteria bacterium SIG31]
MDIITSLKGKIVVSAQAMPNEPFYDEKCIFAMMQSAINGGAQGLRVAGSRDVKIAKSFKVPVIGLTKPNKLPENWKNVVYITPTLKEVQELLDAGADIIAFDGTSRPRPDGCDLKQIIDLIHSNNKLAMADISSLEDGINAEIFGADIISTTLAGYTKETENTDTTPDFNLLEKLVKTVKKPVFLEGRVWYPEEVKKAFKLGAHSVVIGSAITRPHLITKRFTEVL